MEQCAATLTIGQLAHLTSVRTKVIRYYEEIGVLPQPPRGENGYRRYGNTDVNRLHLLRRLRLLGIPLSEAKALLNDASTARCTEIQHGVLSLITERLHAIDQEIQELHLLRQTIEDVQQTIAVCPSTSDEAFRTCEDMRCIGLINTTHQEACCYEH